MTVWSLKQEWLALIVEGRKGTEGRVTYSPSVVQADGVIVMYGGRSGASDNCQFPMVLHCMLSCFPEHFAFLSKYNLDPNSDTRLSLPMSELKKVKSFLNNRYSGASAIVYFDDEQKLVKNVSDMKKVHFCNPPKNKRVCAHMTPFINRPPPNRSV